MPELGSFEKVLRVGEGRRLKRIGEQAEYVLSMQPEFEKLPDEELLAKSAELKQRRTKAGTAAAAIQVEPESEDWLGGFSACLRPDERLRRRHRPLGLASSAGSSAVERAEAELGA